MSIMKTLQDRIQSILKEQIEGFKPSGEGWYQVIIKNRPGSTRYSLGIKKGVVGYNAIFYDFKEAKSIKFSVKEADFEGLETAKTEKAKDLRNSNKFWNDLSPYKDNGYVASHGIEGVFDHLKAGNKGAIAVPYCPVDDENTIVGVKFYAPDFKGCLKGSKMKGSVCFHRKDKNKNIVFICEGLCDALAILKSTNEGWIIESGGLDNVGSILPYLTNNFYRVVLVGENDSVVKYNSFPLQFPKVKVVFPNIGKDIADQYKETGAEGVEQVLTSDNEVKNYRPLGFIGKKYRFVLQDA